LRLPDGSSYPTSGGILRSFLYAHFSESLTGLATIRAYNATARFISDNGKFIDREDSALYVFIGEWTAPRPEHGKV
jgi:hypothetical protein